MNRIGQVDGRHGPIRLFVENQVGEPIDFGGALVSVIIPCYNQAHFLGEAIESVLAQTHPYIEIIVVDDGSADNTSEIATKYPGVQCIRQDNQGLSGARNIGLHESQGNYLVFLDADDRLVPDALETGLTCLNDHPECAFASGHHQYIRADGSLLKEFPAKRVESDHYRALLRGNYIGMHATVIYRRNVLESVGGFDMSLPACEDYDIYLRIARQFPIHCHDKIVAAYRWHDSNMSRNAELMLKTALAVLRTQRKYVRTDKYSKKAYKVGMKSWKAHYGQHLFSQIAHPRTSGERRQVIRVMMTLLRYAPLYAVKHVAGKVMQAGRKTMKAMLPLSIRRLLDQYQGHIYCPPVGRVRFGDLRRVIPISREFGFDRGLPIDRYYIETFLARQANDICGRILEIGDSSYTRKFGGERVTTSDVLHVIEGNPGATIVANLAHADSIPSNTFDCIILTQTLHLIYEIRSAIKTLHRILRPRGILLMTVPGISQISIDEWADSWYWAFTTLSIRRLFEENFLAECIEIESYGNVFATTAFVNGLATEELLQEELDYRDPHYQLLITLTAVKAEERP